VPHSCPTRRSSDLGQRSGARPGPNGASGAGIPAAIGCGQRPVRGGDDSWKARRCAAAPATGWPAGAGMKAALDAAAAARRRRAWLAGSLLLLGLVAAAALIAWGDLEVRRQAGERFVQALADSHAREVGHELTSLETEFRALADALAAVHDVAPEATPLLVDEARPGVTRRHPALADLRLEAEPPGFAAADTPP